MNASQIVRQARRRAHISQRTLAMYAGVAQSTVARIESGKLDPTFGTLQKLLRVCDHRLRVEERPGSGVDRSLIRERLAKTPGERLDHGVAAARAIDELRRSARRVG